MAKLYLEAKVNDIDVRGLIVSGLIYCQGTQEEKLDAFSRLCTVIGNNVDQSDTGSRIINETEIAQVIFWFATLGDLQMSASPEDKDQEEYKKFINDNKDIVSIIAQIDYIDFQ